MYVLSTACGLYAASNVIVEADYLLPNRPCILPVELIRDWEARLWATARPARHTTRWSASPPLSCEPVLHDGFHLLAEQYADHKVPVVITKLRMTKDTADEEGGDEDSQTVRKEMPLLEAISLMEEALRANASRAVDGDDRTLVYIKDWHLVRQERQLHGCQARGSAGQTSSNGSLRLPYRTPDLFRDDWMNYATVDTDDVYVDAEIPDDFRFCYAGMAGTRTGLHCDVYKSYSWSTNLVGRKRWTLYSPELGPLLRRKMGRGERLTAEEEEELARKMHCEGQWHAVVDQEPGETIFVPSGCFHEVHNLTDAISLNHNWCNSVNIPLMYESMKEGMEEVKKALSDVEEMLRDGGGGGEAGEPWQREFWRLVQLVSRSDAGWDWRQFWKMVAEWLSTHVGKEKERSERVTPAALHPDLETFVLPRVRALVEDFAGVEEQAWLDGETLHAHEYCVRRCDGCSFR